MEHFGVMQYFKVLIGRDDVENPKPHPEPIFKALEKLDTQNKKIYMIGDTCLDCISAKSCVEIHTGKFCNLVNKSKNYKNELKKIKAAVSLGNKLGLEVHAGHGLTYKSAKILAKISGIKEFNIGHFLIGESIFVGLNKTIKNFRKIVK
jgi:pyridoxine 5'-phosphate synthase PdxJ